MSMGTNFELDGLKEMNAKLEKMGIVGSKIQNNAIKAGGEVLQKSISEHVVVSDRNETHIRDDIVVSNVKNKNEEKYVEVGAGKETAWRAKFLEFGTSKMSARPFMSPAMSESQDDVLKAIAEKMREGLNEI